MYLFYILCSGSCKSSAALCVLLIVLSHENISLFLASKLNDDDHLNAIPVCSSVIQCTDVVRDLGIHVRQRDVHAATH